MNQYSKVELGDLTKQQIRDVWPFEDKNFTPWLAQEKNLEALGKAIGLDLELVERESKVGNYVADIYAKVEGTEQGVIIENQYGDTNHDHLGKLITYAAGKHADVIIWIVERARDEHRQAVEWINQRTDATTGVFLLEVEVWRIENSKHAVKFNVVERPNNWAKLAASSLTETQQNRLSFWTLFRDTAEQDARFPFSLQSPSTNNWYNLSIGSSRYHICLSALKKEACAGFYIKNDKELYHRLEECKSELEAEIGCKMEWTSATKACLIAAHNNKVSLDSRESWEEAIAWMMEMAVKIKKAFLKRVA